MSDASAAEGAAQESPTDPEVARLARLKAQLEFDEWNSPEARAARAAERAATASEARARVATERQAAGAGLVPNVVTASDGSLTAKETPFGPLLLRRALAQAAEAIVDDLGLLQGRTRKVVVTIDPSLISHDGVYRSVKAELDRLTAKGVEITAIIDSVARPRSLDLGAIAGFAGAAISQVAALFTVKREVSASAVTISADLARTAVIKELLGARNIVAHDEFRMVDASGELVTALGALGDIRSNATEAALVLGVAPDGETEAQQAERVTKIASLNEFIAAVNTFTTQAVSAPEGGRSPLTIAIFHEHLVTNRYDQVLLIQDPVAEVTRVVADRPRHDSIDIVATVSIPYLALLTAGSDRVAGVKGTADTLSHASIATGASSTRIDLDRELGPQVTALISR